MAGADCCVRVCVLRRNRSPFHRGCCLLQLVQQERIESWETSEELPSCHPIEQGKRDGDKEH